eukprot:1043209-Pelagomonas_calceolata.AAC.1
MPHLLHYFMSNRADFLRRNINCRGGQGGLATSEAASSMLVSVVGCGTRLWCWNYLCGGGAVWLGACRRVRMNWGTWFHIEATYKVYKDKAFSQEVQLLACS